ncbi:NAD(+) synthase [Actinomycetaceae bacterium MB13-C1-2]|nr:NAD(+) synthase [Actinomycetaceae bacterium MB13-C1-2]
MSKLREQSIYDQGFTRVAAVSLPVALADPDANSQSIINAARACDEQGACLVVFPEMCVTGYSLDDLLAARELLRGAIRGIEAITVASRDIAPILLVGAPLEFSNALYNCAVVIHRGRILGVQPKEHLASYREFYEKRHFSTTKASLLDDEVRWVGWDSGLKEVPSNNEVFLSTVDGELKDTRSKEQFASEPIYNASRLIPFGQFRVDVTDIPGMQVAIDICEDVWVPIPPSSIAALRGATVIANLSASPVTVGRARRREELVKAQSSATVSAYIYTAAGFGESSNDLSWDGQSLIYENGQKLAAGTRFAEDTTITVADVDLQLLEFVRLQQTSFTDNAQKLDVGTGVVVQTSMGVPSAVASSSFTDLLRPLTLFPFVPDDPSALDEDCYEAFNIQSSALQRRMVSIGQPKLVIGVSGGLDSTLALLVCAKAMDSLGRPRTDIIGYTMPGFGTSSRTRENAETLCRALGVTFHELDIRPAAKEMLSAMGHPYGKGEPVYDVTFENVQAGLRTDYLFRLAGQHGGFVVGTGDLSELALGWCTYGVGDQMSHYGVNAGLPKTLIQHLIRWVAHNQEFAAGTAEVLESILGTEISPELVPSDEDGQAQSTQAAIGPYELQDFTLYWILKGGMTPKRIAYLQAHVWGDKYTDEDILHWLEVFHRRFFANQYKRTAVPNSPKVVGAGSLSPRGDWRMPSDALSKMWLREIEELQAQLA